LLFVGVAPGLLGTSVCVDSRLQCCGSTIVIAQLPAQISSLLIIEPDPAMMSMMGLYQVFILRVPHHVSRFHFVHFFLLSSAQRVVIARDLLKE
jgi:hypothetical protein